MVELGTKTTRFGNAKTEHLGKLELITWNTHEKPNEDYSEDLGWGACLAEEADDLKNKFEVCLTSFPKAAKLRRS